MFKICLKDTSYSYTTFSLIQSRVIVEKPEILSKKLAKGDKLIKLINHGNELKLTDFIFDM